MKLNRRLGSSGVLVVLGMTGVLLQADPAHADVTLLDKDGWQVYTNGRIQAFLNYNYGEGFPQVVTDGNGNQVELVGGGVHRGDAWVEIEDPANAAPDERGTVNEMRVKTGFVGNVLGFGLRKKLDPLHEVVAYYAITSTIETTNRRKYESIEPDARESYAKIIGPWGSLLFGRTLTLFSRGATEITYLYGFAYGLGFPGSISNTGPGAAHVGFGVMGNGFGGGFAYATPVLAGLQATVGVYDPASIPGTPWERTRWPRPEAEVTFEVPLGDGGLIKLFANGAYQKVYVNNDDDETAVLGAGYGGRFEFGPIHLGLAGHYGKGTGLNFAFDPNSVISSTAARGGETRTFDGYYAQLMVSLGALDISTGAGVNRAKQLDLDKVDINDDDANPATPAANDADADPATVDSVGFTTIKSQLGLSAGLTYHITENIHARAEYFRAAYEWYDTTPPSEDGAPTQAFHIASAGMTFDW